MRRPPRTRRRPLTRDEKLDAVDRFEGAFALVEHLVAGASDEALAFVPPVQDAWSVKEHLAHLLDAECAVYFRLRLAVAEPGASVQMWNEEAWHAKLAYASADGRACLTAAKAMRGILATSLRALAGEDWSGFWLEHPERGRIELERLLEIYREHLAYHAPFIKRNLDTWKQAPGR